MDTKTIHINDKPYSKVITEDIIINNGQDAIDLIFSTEYRSIILDDRHINSDFFDLSTGLAGEVIPKFKRYAKKVVILLDRSNYTSKFLDNLISESNKGKKVIFADSVDSAKNKLNN